MVDSTRLPPQLKDTRHAVLKNVVAVMAEEGVPVVENNNNPACQDNFNIESPTRSITYSQSSWLTNVHGREFNIRSFESFQKW